MVQDVLSDTPEQQIDGIIQVRKALELTPKDSIIVESGVIPQLMQTLRGTNTDLQREAAWTLGAIAEGSIASTDLVIQAGAPAELIKLLTSPVAGVQEKAAQALGDISAGYSDARDLILLAGGLPPLLSLLEKSQSPENTQSLSFTRSVALAASLLCRGKDPPPDRELQVSSALPVMVNFIKLDEDYEILNAALWAVYSLSRWSADSIQATINTGVVPRLVACLAHNIPKVQELAAYAIGNIAMGTELQTQVLISAGVLPAFRKILLSEANTNRRTVCWILSNIFHDSSTFVQAAVDVELIPVIVGIFYSATGRLKEESSWAIAKAVWGGVKRNPPQTRYLVDKGCVQPLCEILDTSDGRLLRAVLGGLENVVAVGQMDREMAGESSNRYSVLLEKHGGLGGIHRLIYHGDSQISKEAAFIIREVSDGDEPLPDE